MLHPIFDRGRWDQGAITMIGNGKFEPFTVWNDIKLRYRITAYQWTS